MATGTLIRHAQFKKHYDAIIIGSGISGLAAAASLAKAGQSVLVLERHYTAGGFTHSYQRKGYEWDVGVHYIGEVHRPFSVLRQLFDYVSDGELKWAEMEPVYDKICLGTESFDFVKGEAAFIDKMVQYFPDEREAITRYVALIKQVNRSSSYYFMEKVLPAWLAWILHRKLSLPFLAFAEKTTEEVLLTLTSNKKLIAVLTGQWGDYGLPPGRSSFVIHAMVAKHYLAGGCYPVGGAAQIASTIGDVITKHKGQIVLNAPVKEILVKGHTATGVVLNNGFEIRATRIISTIGLYNTYFQLLPKELGFLDNTRAALEKLDRSMGHICLFIGLKGTREELKLPSHNLWIYPDAQHDQNYKNYMREPSLNFPMVYISFPSSRDPAWSKQYAGKSTIQIIVPAPFSWFERWRNTTWQKRGLEYEVFKKSITEKLFEQLYQALPHLRDKVHYSELSTPLTTAHFANYRLGEIYGLSHDPKRFLERMIRFESPVHHLTLAGQDLVTAGVGGALMSGVLAAISILGPFKARHLIRLVKPKKRDLKAPIT